MYRHGDRAPLVYPYPKDYYTSEYWPRGWGGITNLGLQQSYELGKFFRSRYIEFGFVSEIHNQSEVLIKASELDRTIISTQAILYAMYPVRKNPAFQWNPEIDWQPIPFYTTNIKTPDLDTIPSNIVCPRQIALFEKFNETCALHYGRKYEKLFAYLSKVTGWDNFSYFHVDRIYDVQREVMNGLLEHQPDWVFKRWPEYENKTTLEIFLPMRHLKYHAPFADFESAKATTGVTLKRWIDRALNVTRSKSKVSPKLIMFGSNDWTMYSLLRSFELHNYLLVPYCAALIMEVYSNDNGEYDFQILYRNDTSVPPYNLKIPSCEMPCPVKKLPILYANSTLNNIEEMYKYCGSPPPKCFKESR